MKGHRQAEEENCDAPLKGTPVVSAIRSAEVEELLLRADRQQQKKSETNMDLLLRPGRRVHESV